VTHLRQIMLEELERRNYAPGTITCYIRTVEHFARCRVGGGALTRWPPSAAQTVHAVFPHTAFTKTRDSKMQQKGNKQVGPSVHPSGWVGSSVSSDDDVRVFR
jgi:hypothetical protein